MIQVVGRNGDALYVTLSIYTGEKLPHQRRNFAISNIWRSNMRKFRS